MKPTILAALCLLAYFNSASVSAADREDVCVHYAANYGWSKGYQVTATIETGTELNQATRTYNFQAFDKYVVIFWDQDQVSVIKMRAPFFLGPIDALGEDQQGRQWHVSNSSFCP